MTTSEALWTRAQRRIPGGVNSPVRAYPPYPFFIRRGEGPYLYSVEGARYVDYCLAFGPLIFGHADPDLQAALRMQLADGFLYGAPTEQEVELAELLSTLVPSAEMVRLVNTGLEATLHAVRLARAVTNRPFIVKFEGGYHGAHDYVLTRAGSGVATFSVPDTRGIPPETVRNTLTVPFNDIDHIEGIFAHHASHIAAVLVEPVLGNIGPVPPTDGFLPALRRLTHDAGALLIFDEVITGFRLGLAGAQGYYHIRPDLTVLGKVLGGGLPIAALCGASHIMSELAPAGPVYQAGTFSGNPLSVTAALTTLRKLRRDAARIYPSLDKLGEELRHGLQDVVADDHISAQVRGLASLFQIFFTATPVRDYHSAKTSDLTRFQHYFRQLLAHQIFAPGSQFETCFLSTTHTPEHVTQTLEAADAALRSTVKLGA